MWQLFWVTGLATCAVVCGAAGTAAGAASIQGSVHYFSGHRPVPNVVVDISGVSTTAVTTQGTGDFLALGLPLGTWRIEPRQTSETSPSLDVADGLKMLAAAAGALPLSAAERFACDVTGNGTVSALDAALTLRYVLGAIPTLPAWQACGSPTIFLPSTTHTVGVTVFQPLLTPSLCTSGAISATLNSAPWSGYDFTAVRIGDCDGTWQPPAPLPTSTPTRTPSPSLTPTRTLSPSLTPTLAPTATPSRTPTPSPSFTPTRTPSPNFTSTRTASPSLTPTRTPSPSLTPTVTPTATPTQTPTPTQPATPGSTATALPDPTACAAPAVWNLAPPSTLFTHQNGEVWLTEAIPTDTGWGVFWLRRDADAPSLVRLYYAHVGFAGEVQVGPLHLRNMNSLQWRRRYYITAWHQDHFGMLIAEGSTLYYYNLSKAGVLSGQRTVGPTLFNSALYGQESDGDMVSYPGGFGVIIEGNCSGHLCAYGFRLAADGTPTSSVYNLVDFDYTHQFDPRIAFDGAGFALLSVKDGGISVAGVVTKYMTTTGSPSSRARVVPTKEYYWDEWPDVAWNGDHFAALWTENSGRDHNTPWRMRFGSFRRNSSGSTPLGEAIIEVLPGISRVRHWTTQVHSLGATWLAQYTRYVDGPNATAVYRWLNDQGEILGTLEPFLVNTDALASNVHPSPDAAGRIAITRALQEGSEIEVLFQLLDRPTCGE